MDTIITLIIILTLGGFVLICAEALLPGMIAGIMGGLLLILAAAVTGLSYGFTVAFIYCLGVLVIGGIGFCFWLKYFDKLPFGKKIILSGPEHAEYPGQSESPSLIGQKGKALTPLRPAGTIEIGGQRYDVVTEGKMIASGQFVEIISVSGTVITVREVQSPDKTISTSTNS